MGKTMVLPLLAATALVAAAAAIPGSASAAPAGAAPIAAPGSLVEEARMMRRHRWRRYGYRYRRMGRRASPSQAGNADNPSRPVYQQNQGTTTGGPRY